VLLPGGELSVRHDGSAQVRDHGRRARRVDPVPVPPVDSRPPVADWIRFLSELLAKEFLREQEGDAA
jgi:hypothetical protein